MIRRPALALLLALIPGLASAQFATIAPTPATSDNGDRIATTAWARNFLSGGLLLPSGQIFIGSVGGLAVAQTPSADLTVSTGGAFTLATVNGNVGTFGSATQCVTVTNNAKGLTTAVSAATCAPAIGSITGLGTGIAAALAINTGSAGAPVLFNGAGGTPSSITLTNGTGLPTTGLTGTLQAAQEPVHTGDVANTAGSLALTIQPNAVTNAKQATMTANTIKANATSGAAVPADVAVSSCSGVQNFLQWVTNTGPQCGTAPSWTIAGGTVSAQATTTITVSGSPNTIELFIEQLDVSSAGSDIWLRLNGDSAANYQFAYNIVGTAGTVSGAGAAAQGFCKVIPNVKAGFGARATVTLNAPLNVAITKHMTLRSANTDNTTATLSSLVGSCFWNSSAAITSVTILPSAGTTSFLYQMVGYK